MSVFAERIRELRDTQGLTQDAIGKVIGKSREAISKYEVGEHEPDLVVIAALAKYFDVTADYIIGITDDSELINGRRKSQGPYEKYLKDKDFIPHLRLAIKIKENNVDIAKVEKFVNSLIRQIRKQTHP